MKKALGLILVMIVTFLAVTRSSIASTPAKTYAGYFVMESGSPTIWYIDTKNYRRYYLGAAPEAYPLLVSRVTFVDGLGETIADIPLAGTSDTGVLSTRQNYRGRIINGTVDNTLAYWYVDPDDLLRYPLDRATLFDTITPLVKTITAADLKTIPLGYAPPPKPGSSGLVKKSTTVVTSRGTFQVDYVMYDYRAGTYKIMTDTGNSKDCLNNCTVLPLRTYIQRRKAVAGIHGSYFCPRDYPKCAKEIGFYYYAVYNSFSKVMINDRRIKYTPDPIVAFDTTSRPFMLTPLNTYKSAASLTEDLATRSLAAGGSGKLQAAISNGPWLVHDGKARRSFRTLDTKQTTVKTMRGVLAWQGARVYLMIVKRATVPDAGAVVATMGMDNAMNLDGGGSTALYYNGKYLDGPGRDLPNSILIVKK